MTSLRTNPMRILTKLRRINGVTHLELGCGSDKREGFFGIDILPDPAVDLVMDIEKHPLPFADNSIDHVYTSHTFEHLTDFRFVLREIFRVCKPGALVEIWTPYGKSNDGMLFGHYTFMSETSFKHVCFEYDRFYLGDKKGYFAWQSSHYNLHPNIVEDLAKLKIPIDFALDHMFNIALEWGVFLQVIKDENIERAPGPQYPSTVFYYGGREKVIKTGHPAEQKIAPKAKAQSKSPKKRPAKQSLNKRR